MANQVLTNWLDTSDGWKARGRTGRGGAGDPDPGPEDPGGGGGSGFVHPGVMYSEAQLDLMATEVANSGSNRKSKYDTMLSRTATGGTNVGMAYSSLSWTPHPLASIGRGSSGSPDQGGSDLMADSMAALVHAMIWRLKGTRANASKASAILNAMSSTITQIMFDTSVWSDGKLLAGWTGTLIARAGEIMAYSGYTATGGETAFNKAALQNLLKTVWVPQINTNWNGGGANWIQSFTDSMIQIGVFCDDQTIFDTGVAMWRGNVPSIFYMSGDVNSWPQLAASTPPASGLPISSPGTMYDKSSTSASSLRSYWRSPTSWPSGLEGEMGRDFHHTAMGYAATFNAAETAWHQGVDLYTEQQNRLVTSCELFTKYIYDTIIGGVNPPPNWPFSAKPTFYATATQRAIWELPYMHYHNRKGVSMPNTLATLNGYTRGSTFDIDVFIMCEEMTFRDNVG